MHIFDLCTRVICSYGNGLLGNAYKPSHEGYGCTGIDIGIMALDHAVSGIVHGVRRHNDVLAAFAARVR